MGDLANLGYSVLKSDQSRHIAVKKAVKKFGRILVMQKLVASSNWTKKNYPARSAVYYADMKYVQNSK